MDKKIALSFLYQFFKRIDMVLESLTSFFGCHVARVRFFAYELFFDHDVIFCFQGLCMACQVTIGHAEEFLERVEVGKLVHHEYAHDAQAYAMVKGLVDML